MSEKPEALRLAEELEAFARFSGGGGMDVKAAAELRSLHAENERLREALTYDWDQLEACRESLREHMVEIKRLRGLLTEVRGAKWLVVQDNLLDRIDAALRRERT